MAEAIFHITTKSEWAARSGGQYVPASYPVERFIHFSTSSQFLSTSNRLFKGRNDLLVLEVDPEGLESNLVFENLEGGSELFPHLYSALPIENVVSKFCLKPDEEGDFQWGSEKEENSV